MVDNNAILTIPANGEQVKIAAVLPTPLPRKVIALRHRCMCCGARSLLRG
jgi:hypothetical protein